MASKTLREWLLGSKKGTQPNYNGVYPRSTLIGNEIVIYPTGANDFIKDGYRTNDIFYSIIKLISNKVCLPTWGVFIIKDKKKYQKYLSLHSSLKYKGVFEEMLYYKDHSVEQVTDTKLDALLQYPNESQTWDDLLTEACIFYNTTGNIYQGTNLLDGGANTGLPETIFTLPAHLMTIVAKNVFPARVESYKLNLGQILDYTKEQVLHLKMPNPSYTINGEQLYGMSPLQAAAGLITRTNESTKSGAIAFKNRGANGAAFINDPNFNPDDSVSAASQLKDQWYKEHYHDDNKGGIQWTSHAIGYTAFGGSPADLKIIDSEKWDLTRFCNVFGVPVVLLNPDRAIQNNMKEAEKSLTTRAAIPFLDMYRDGLNRKFSTDWGYKGSGRFIDYDESSFYELQDDMGEKTGWVNNAWGITLKERLELLGMSTDNLSDDELNQRYVPNNIQLLTEVGMEGQMAVADNALNKSGLNDY